MCFKMAGVLGMAVRYAEYCTIRGCRARNHGGFRCTSEANSIDGIWEPPRLQVNLRVGRNGAPKKYKRLYKQIEIVFSKADFWMLNYSGVLMRQKKIHAKIRC